MVSSLHLIQSHQGHQVFFGHPLCLMPSTSHVSQRLTQSLSSFRSRCPNRLNLLFLIIKLTGCNPKSSLSSSLFFLSFSLTPHIHLIDRSTQQKHKPLPTFGGCRLFNRSSSQCFYFRNNPITQVSRSEGRRPLGAVVHTLNEPSEFSQ